MLTIKSKIESLLLISSRPLKISKIANLVEAKTEEVRQVLEELYNDYKNREGGMKLLKTNNEWQFGTAPENSSVIGQFLQEELSGELTRPQLETLTIIAYRGPIAKMEIEQIRGINCGLILRNLLIRGLIELEEEKKNKLPLYSVSMDFLKFLGLTRIEDLPNYGRLHGNEILEAYLKQAQEQ